MNDMVDFRTRLEYNWSWEESGATSLSSERVVEVLTHPVLLAPPISKPTFTVAKWQAIFCRPSHQSKTDKLRNPASSPSNRGACGRVLPDRGHFLSTGLKGSPGGCMHDPSLVPAESQLDPKSIG